MYFRSDLALEVCSGANVNGVTTETQSFGDVQMSRTRILTSLASKRIGKPVGEYITFEMPKLSDDISTFETGADKIAQVLSGMLSPGLCLVVGLGNLEITPDALGPKTASRILATRHISEQAKKSMDLEQLGNVAVISPGVLGKTGIESAQIVAGIAQRIEPSCVIVIDAFAAKSVSRLGCTVQLSNAGISPGSGVGNSRKELSRRTLGIPVVSIGVPTVVDAATLAADLMNFDSEQECKEALGSDSMFVTPREIDLIIDRASKLLSLSINRALQPDFSDQEIEQLL